LSTPHYPTKHTCKFDREGGRLTGSRSASCRTPRQRPRARPPRARTASNPRSPPILYTLLTSSRSPAPAKYTSGSKTNRRSRSRRAATGQTTRRPPPQPRRKCVDAAGTARGLWAGRAATALRVDGRTRSRLGCAATATISGSQQQLVMTSEKCGYDDDGCHD
jgi:hypothetical protein